MLPYRYILPLHGQRLCWLSLSSHPPVSVIEHKCHMDAFILQLWIPLYILLCTDLRQYSLSLQSAPQHFSCTVHCVCVCVCVCVFIGVCPAVSSPVTVGGSCGGCSGYGRGLSVAIGGGSSSSSSRVASLETHTQAHTHTHTHTKELTRTAVRKKTPGLRCRQRWNILTFYSKERLIFMTSLQKGLYLVTSEEILLILQDDYFIFSVILEVIF